MNLRRVEVLGVPVDLVDMAGAVAVAEKLLHGERPAAVIAVNPEKVMKARREPRLLEALRAAGLLIPDGIGVVLAARLLGLGRSERVPGSELMPRLCELAAGKGYRVFLYGARPEVNDRAAEVLASRYPGLQIVGRAHGYLDPEESEALPARINESDAQIVFVALGSPHQEYWIHRNLGALTSVRVCQGVGGTFDVIAGRVRRAPAWSRRLHLEWLYRLLSQPARIRRHGALVEFAVAVLRQRLVRAS